MEGFSLQLFREAPPWAPKRFSWAQPQLQSPSFSYNHFLQQWSVATCGDCGGLPPLAQVCLGGWFSLCFGDPRLPRRRRGDQIAWTGDRFLRSLMSSGRCQEDKRGCDAITIRLEAIAIELRTGSKDRLKKGKCLVDWLGFFHCEGVDVGAWDWQVVVRAP